MTKPHSGNLSIIPAAAVFDHRLSHADVRVLAALGAHADKNGRCWPATTTLANETGMSERHARTSLRNLENIGYVVTESRPGQSSLYRIPRNYTAGVPRNQAAGVEPNPGTILPEPRNQAAGDPGTVLPPNDTKNDTKNDNKNDNKNGVTENNQTGVPVSDQQFQSFWRTYPSRRPHSNPKKPARAKFDAALKRGVSAWDIIRGAQNYAAYIKREGTNPKYVAQAKTWLNEERWPQYQEAAGDDAPTPIML